jgi:transcriptional regulator with XRE-family HTH domain
MRVNRRSAGRAVRLLVGRNVRELRRLRGFSQERLAELVGNSSKHIGLIEQGGTNVGLDLLARIAAALSVNVTDLFAEPRNGDAPKRRVYVITERELDRLEQLLRTVRSVRRTS